MKLKGNEKYHPKIIKNDKICVTKYLWKVKIRGINGYIVETLWEFVFVKTTLPCNSNSKNNSYTIIVQLFIGYYN